MSAGSSAPGAGADTVDVPVAAPNGTYVGRRSHGVSEFLGIRYAGPALRWRSPRAPATTRDDVITAFSWGDSCVQPRDPVELASLAPQSEDCLTLNVWTRRVAHGGKPVMVFIHGGGGISGGSIDPLYRGRNLVSAVDDAEDVVVVTINYRLGVFGTLNLEGLPDFRDEYRDGLNLWLRDHQAALGWVQRNIAAFGGDPANVTVLGQSAGAGFISTHLGIPESRSLFARAIVQSGPLVNRQVTLEQSRGTAESVLGSLGLRTLDELLRAPAETIVSRAIQGDGPAFGGAVFFPVTDGDFVPLDGFGAILAGHAKEIDLLVGTTDGERDAIVSPVRGETGNRAAPERVLQAISRYESTVAGAASALTVTDHPEVLASYLQQYEDETLGLIDLCNDINYRTGAELMAEAQSLWNARTYGYLWSWAPSPERVLAADPERGEVSPFGRALHCTELPFVLRNADGMPSVTGPAESLPAGLADQASGAWLAFARTGIPSASGAPPWEPYRRGSRAIMRIDSEWTLECDPRAATRRILAALPLAARIAAAAGPSGSRGSRASAESRASADSPAARNTENG